MATWRLHSARVTLAFACSLSGVAAMRTVEGELLMTSQAAAAKHPECTASVPGSVIARRTNPKVKVECSCPTGTSPDQDYEPINYLDGSLCWEDSKWEPSTKKTRQCSCKQKCIRRVYWHILVNPDFTVADVAFPNALPGLTADDLRCLFNLGGQAASLNGGRTRGSVILDDGVTDDGVTETVVWYSADDANSAYQGVTSIWKNVKLPVNTNVMALGDIHGRLGSLRRAWKDWWSRGMQDYVVGLGDMIDRGNRQLEVAAGMIAWKAMFPHKVSFVRGNHESENMANNYGFSCVDIRGPYEGAGFVRKVLLFMAREVPVVLRLEQPNPEGNAVFMHGGFGPQVLESLENGLRHRENTNAVRYAEYMEIVWSEFGDMCIDGERARGGVQDCSNVQGEGSDAVHDDDPTTMFNKAAYRGMGFYFSRQAVRTFLEYVESCIIVLGHSHKSFVERISVEDSRCNFKTRNEKKPGLARMVVLTAHQFNRYRRQSPDLASVANQGAIGLITFDGDGSVTVDQRYLFGADEYDEVYEMLDVGVPGGAYPQEPECDWMFPVDGTQLYTCSGYTCPEPK